MEQIVTVQVIVMYRPVPLVLYTSSLATVKVYKLQMMEQRMEGRPQYNNSC